MDFRRLGYFLAVADHGSFTGAAKAIFVSQPAVSLAVKELEQELGAELFHRLGRRVTLTAAGEALVGPARQVLRDVQVGTAAVAAVTGLAAGHLDICCLPTLAVRPGARLIGRFRQEFPGVTVDMSVADDPARLVELLRSGDCELGITEAAMVPSELEHHVLMDQELVVVLPPGSAWQARPVSLSRLRSTPFVTTPPGTSTRRLLDEAFAAVGAQPEVVVVTTQREALLPLVLAGAGATLLPEAVAHTAVGEGAVIARPRPAIRRTVVLAHRSGPLSPAAAAFVELSEPAARTPPPA
jgi:LysR family transcriptional regulator, carnitine catabolism transcriptional activator